MVKFTEKNNEGQKFRILSLDGGGAKGFYTLGVLKEIESLIETPLHHKFDLIFGTSTGAIIASLISLGYNTDSILELYRKYVPAIMSKKSAYERSVALEALAHEVFGDAMFEDVKTGIGIVTAKWLTERPMIFKGNIMQAHGRRKSFIPGFGVSIADAVKASCSAYPFFERTIVRTFLGEEIELIDGGYCANNPTLYAIADAIKAYNIDRHNVRVVNIGVGNYPEPKPRLLMHLAKKYLVSVQLLQKTLEINTQSMDQLRQIMFDDVPTIRISDSYVAPEMATGLLEHDIKKLNILFQRGRESFSSHESELLKYVM
jgi:uncharacterized protein